MCSSSCIFRTAPEPGEEERGGGGGGGAKVQLILFSNVRCHAHRGGTHVHVPSGFCICLQEPLAPLCPAVKGTCSHSYHWRDRCATLLCVLWSVITAR